MKIRVKQQFEKGYKKVSKVNSEIRAKQKQIGVQSVKAKIVNSNEIGVQGLILLSFGIWLTLKKNLVDWHWA